MNIKTNFGKRLKELRIKKGISQEKLGQLSGIHRTYISEIERGITNVTLDHIYKIVIALNISLHDFFNF